MKSSKPKTMKTKDASSSSFMETASDMKKTIKGQKNAKSKKRLAPAWHDPDDQMRDEDGITSRKTKTEARVGELYKNRLVESFEMVYGPTPSWARLDKLDKKKRKKESDDEDEEEESEMIGIGSISSKSALHPGKLNILKLTNLNASERPEGKFIKSVGFHPKNPVGLVANSSGIVSLYQVDGSANTHIQSVTFENFPLRKAQFSVDGEEVYASSGLAGHFYSYDMRSGEIVRIKPCHVTRHETIRNLVASPDDKILVAVGHGGQMYLYSKKSKEMIDKISINGEVKDVAFNPSGSEMFAYGDEGEVYRWNMNSRRCVEKFSSEGAFDGSCLAVSSKYIACGSSSGFVSVLENKFEPAGDNEVISCRIRKPLGELGNLQTVISSLKFNSSEEILAMGSVESDNGLRLVHLPSLTVFPRFPFVNANYGRPNCIAFSPNSGYLCVGNNRGCAHLFRLKHYENY